MKNDYIYANKYLMPAPKGNKNAVGNEGGRPTKYKPEYCEMLISHMESGYSFMSFAGIIDVSSDTLYEWEKTYVEFSYAKKAAFEKSRIFWELVGINIATKGIGNATAYIFNMKNRFPNEWKDKQEMEHSGNVGITGINYIIPNDTNDKANG